MIDSARLLSDLKRELKALETDLRERAEDAAEPWGARLRDEYDAAIRRDRTGLSWIEWRNGEVSQAAVAWIISTVFIRFAEDNGLLAGVQRHGRAATLPWIASSGDGLERAVENEQAFYASAPTATSRDWLQEAFGTLAGLPAGRPLVDPDHSAVWHAPISAAAADALVAFFRRTTPTGELAHDFSDPELGTRFLGDLYQDLSDYAKKTFALLQTPDFVEEFILDETLTPAMAEFGLTGLKLIDPACGSGHFLLGAFDRLVGAWSATAPGIEKGERVQRALDSIHGVDLNPFAIAIARFRLTVAAIRAAGIASLAAAPAFRYHLAIGDSLLGNVNPTAALDLGDGEYFDYDAEDLREYAGILESGQYHVVVANPPYIQPPDAKLRDAYRALYPTCHGKYALSVPFMELLFRLAKRADGGGAGYVGQITSNSFMKREFGKKLIERFLSGGYTGLSPDYVDLTHIIDTSGAYIPGHGTPTVILIGRPRKPHADEIRAVLGVRGEPGQPSTPAEGLVWRDIVEHLGDPGYDGSYVSVVDVPRSTYATFPWSLSGGGAAELKERIEAASRVRLGDVPYRMGVFGIQGADDAFIVTHDEARRRSEPRAFRPLVVGDIVRDWAIGDAEPTFFPYDDAHNLQQLESYPVQERSMWRLRTELGNRATFSRGTYFSDGRPWHEWHQLPQDRGASGLTITFAFVATHNHFVLDRGGKVFKQSAPVIKLPEGATEADHYELLGVLNSSVACFWLKQVSHNKGGPGGGSSKDEKWRDFYEFTATKLQDFPLPAASLQNYAERLDRLAQEQSALVDDALRSQRSLIQSLTSAAGRWSELRSQMIALQEELDWAAYRAYGLTDLEPLSADAVRVAIQIGERPVEIALAQRVAAGEIRTRWLAEFASVQSEVIPNYSDTEYQELIPKRLVEIENNAAIRLLESPDYKRKWESVGWERLVAKAVRVELLDRLESAELWYDASGRPLARSAAQLADELRRDDRFRELMTIHLGSRDFDLATQIGKLLEGEAVPALAALRYKPSGIEKFRAWERTWELQRAEDAGERIDVSVPPKYTQADFLKQSYWSARGKLDVPKERFIAFPGSRVHEDPTDVYGWAGWDHAERGQAIARLANDVARAGGPTQHVLPLVGALVELEPWLAQWHNEVDARTGISPAAAIGGVISTLLGRMGLGRAEALAWRPPAPVRGRRRAS